jgi:hypothetical protein
MLKRILLSATLLACPLPAMANSISGTLSIFPAASYNPNTDQITFNGGSALPPTLNGDFASVITGTQVLAMQNMSVAIPQTQIGSGSDLFCGVNCVFALMNFSGPILPQNFTGAATMQVQTANFSTLPGIDFIITGDAIMSLTGFDPTPGVYSLSIQSGHFWNPQGAYFNNWTGLSWSEPPTPVPGPIIGAGLPGLVAACIGLVALARRRARTAESGDSRNATGQRSNAGTVRSKT